VVIHRFHRFHRLSSLRLRLIRSRGHHPDRRFEAPGPNQRWVGDTTEFVIGGSGKLYLAVVLDLFSRFVVGWAVSAVNDRHVTIKALDIALKRRCPDAGLLHHSDQGCT
jgi:putative transposase